ncbi:MAG: hypothetical protein ACJ74J_05825 [Blastocatellia bacterium]
MRVGITGHQRLEEPTDWRWVGQEFDHLLSRLLPPLIGVTSLAIGADQFFAEAVLQQGGSLEAVIPFAGYESTFSEGLDRREYNRLLRLVCKSEVLERQGSDEDAYFAAGKRVVDLSELVLAVWNGKPAAGLGGTADVVRYAIQQRKRIIHLDPIKQKVSEFQGQG